MSKNGFVLSNVVCNTYDDNIKGDLLAVGTTKKDSTNRGLVLYFQPEGTCEWKYIKSFILLPKEVENILEHGQTIVRDIGFILSFQPLMLEVFDLGSFTTGNKPAKFTEYYSTFEIGTCTFSISLGSINDRNPRGVVYDREYKRGNLVGFEKVIKASLREPVENNNNLVPSIVPNGLEFVRFE